MQFLPCSVECSKHFVYFCMQHEICKHTMEEKLKYVQPFYYGDGCGFFAGNYFITAGHCFKEYDGIIVNLDGVSYEFRRESADFIKYDEDETEGLDLAIFKVPGINSPISLERYEPKADDKLRSVSFKHMYKKGQTIFDAEEWFELTECTADVTGEIMGNYFITVTDKSLKKGSSGSPVFLGDKVVGILCGGNNDNTGKKCDIALPLNWCFNLRSNAILQVLETL